MPRFYFNFRNGERTAENEGLEFKNVESARREAIISILEMSKAGGKRTTGNGPSTYIGMDPRCARSTAG
jgi:hypothetical protein